MSISTVVAVLNCYESILRFGGVILPLGPRCRDSSTLDPLLPVLFDGGAFADHVRFAPSANPLIKTTGLTDRVLEPIPKVLILK